MSFLFDKSIKVAYTIMAIANWLYIIYSSHLLTQKILKANELANVFIGMIFLLMCFVFFYSVYLFSRPLRKKLKGKIAVVFQYLISPNALLGLIVFIIAVMENGQSTDIWAEIFIPLVIINLVVVFLYLVYLSYKSKSRI